MHHIKFKAIILTAVVLFAGMAIWMLSLNNEARLRMYYKLTINK